jgi:hypothetical protein
LRIKNIFLSLFISKERTGESEEMEGAAEVQNETLVVHKGGCHCGRVHFEIDAPEVLEVDDCNCSICAHPAHSFYLKYLF